MKNKRLFHLMIITLVYILAGVIGIVAYNHLNFHFAINLLISDVIATSVVFMFSLIFKNASVYDPYWSVQPIVISLALAFNNEFSIETFLVVLAISLWAIRLTANWCYTFNDFSYQDWRYVMLKEKTKKLYPIVSYLGIHMFPTIVVYLCVLPVLFLFNANAEINELTIFFFVFTLLAITIQTISDIQMHIFKKSKTKKLIRMGLWKYSRHPNYLAEIMMWFGVAGMCVSMMIDKYYLFIGAIVNMLMFLFVSIPMAEKRQSKKEGFEQYKKETRMLLPFKKKVK